MLAKKNRASKELVEEIFKKGRFVNSRGLSFKFILMPGSQGRNISFIAPKSVAKGAVERNTLRRRGYNILKKYLQAFPEGIRGVFVFKKSLILPEIENEIKILLNKVN